MSRKLNLSWVSVGYNLLVARRQKKKKVENYQLMHKCVAVPKTFSRLDSIVVSKVNMVVYNILKFEQVNPSNAAMEK